MTRSGPSIVYEPLHVGDLAPWFRQHCIGQAGLFSFDMVAGRFVALCFYGSAKNRPAAAVLDLLEGNRGLFDNVRLAFYGVATEAADATDQRLAPSPGVRHFADFDGQISRAFGAAPRDGPPSSSAWRPFWCILDPRLRVIAIFPLTAEGDGAAFDFLRALPTPAAYGEDAQVPVLAVPGVFEPDFCARLIGLHQTGDAQDSAILTEGASLTDHGFKRRRDVRLVDKATVDQVQARIFRRLVPELRHAFQFNATRLERLILACYDAEEKGRFGPHRDNTVAATAHRRFAVSINLNDDFEGGGIVFPEYSQRAFRPPIGGALVFSCSMMHAVAPMTRGRRYACLPFVYDDAAAASRAHTP